MMAYFNIDSPESPMRLCQLLTWTAQVRERKPGVFSPELVYEQCGKTRVFTLPDCYDTRELALGHAYRVLRHAVNKRRGLSPARWEVYGN